MERALDPSLLATALGDHDLLPSPQELGEALAEAELALLIHRPEFPDYLEGLAWYLHAVASSRYATERFGVERQRAAFAVSSHIFDLMLLSMELSVLDRLKITFAAQIAALRGNANPNAIAMYLREARPLFKPWDLVQDGAEVSIALGVALLGLDVRYVYETTNAMRTQASMLASEWAVQDIAQTPFGPPAIVAAGVRDLMSFLVYGSERALPRAEEGFRSVVGDRYFDQDRTSQWVAAHLLNLTGDLRSSSIWSLLPPSLPSGVARAFAMGHPRVVSLWPPQIEFITPERPSSPSPFSADVRRLFLSTPTSSGKTLTAQLLIAAHIATSSSAVCYVAPTRSLCREVARSIDQRIRYLGATSVHDLPEGALLPDDVAQHSAIEIMTPERLSFILRSDPEDVLRRFGMFVFDEVHTVGDRSRGWTLEQEISFLHSATRNTPHRMAILSAAIGNRAHFIEWLSPEATAVFHRHSSWRGPRRVSAIWSTLADWNASATESTRSARYPQRIVYPLYGRLDARLGSSRKTHSLRTTAPIGELAFRISPTGERTRDPSRTTSFTHMLDPIVLHLAEAGPVLVIESTRRRTLSLARHLANSRQTPESVPKSLAALSELTRARMGDEHPLVGMIPRGVAYHHGGLSPDVRAAIEDAVRDGHIQILVATTTLTEGVNLPVRSVVIASQGSYGANGYEEYITGSRLINAIGRAGRATRETEGVVVFARQAAPSVQDFQQLQPSDEETVVQSTIANKDALDALARFEAERARAEDAILSYVEPPISDFIAYIWFVASAIERAGDQPADEAIANAVRSTLGWRQLAAADGERWLHVAHQALASYRATSQQSRVRWATTGTSIGSARAIEELAMQAAGSLQTISPFAAPGELILAIFDGERLGSVLSLREAPRLTVYNRRATPREPIEVDIQALISDWLSGQELTLIAQRHLADVDPPEFQFEQLSDLTNHLLEVFLPWILGCMLPWMNESLEEAGAAVRLPQSLPAYLRWGVGNEPALYLMLSGLYSRTLAARASEAWIRAGTPDTIVEWLQSMNLAQWRERLSASISDLRQLLELVRLKPEGLAYSLVSTGKATISVRSDLTVCPLTPVEILQDDPQEVSTIRILSYGQPLGEILSRDHSDMQSILSSGLPFSASFEVTVEGATLIVELMAID